jgi:hypothetical protein
MWVDGNGIFFFLDVARLPEVKENVFTCFCFATSNVCWKQQQAIRGRSKRVK